MCKRLLIEGHTQTERDGKRYFMKMEMKKIRWGSNTYTDNIDFKTKAI